MRKGLALLSLLETFCASALIVLVEQGVCWYALRQILSCAFGSSASWPRKSVVLFFVALLFLGSSSFSLSPSSLSYSRSGSSFSSS